MHLSPEHRVHAVVAFIVPIVLVLLVAAGWGGARVQAASVPCPSGDGAALAVEDLRCAQ